MAAVVATATAMERVMRKISPKIVGARSVGAGAGASQTPVRGTGRRAGAGVRAAAVGMVA
ncbi:hypothetical protein GCM10025783_01370 [Amnibacterium soli]|uniref:Uncharacterized protein n=1 Tax=Amnibacterium soli TaxID=1282736 RepID=A0ABP8YR37_9MICO